MMKGVLLFSVLAGLVLHHVFYFYGHFGFDDLYYAELAERLRHGGWDPSDPYSYRLLPLLLTAGTYSLFGVNDAASAIPPLLATSVIVYLLFSIFRKAHLWQLLLAFGLYFAMKWNLFYSDKLMPDQFVSAGTFAGWVAYERWRTGRGKLLATCALAATGLFLAFNSKGTVILAVPLFLYYFIADLRRGDYRWWAVFSGLTGLLLALYFLWVYGVSGSPLSRFTAISTHHYLNPCSYDILPREELYSRLTDGFLFLIGDAGLWPHMLIATLGLLFLRNGRGGYAGNRVYPITTVIALLSINFMTISLTSYNPVCLDSRHILLFSPILAVCSVMTVRDMGRRFGVRTGGWPFLAAVSLVVALLLIPTVRQANYGRTLNYRAVRPALQQSIASLPGGSTVYGSQGMVNYAGYLTGFRNSQLTFLPLSALPACDSVPPGERTFLVRNWYTDWHAKIGNAQFDGGISGAGYVAEEVPGPELVRIQRLKCAIR